MLLEKRPGDGADRKENRWRVSGHADGGPCGWRGERARVRRAAQDTTAERRTAWLAGVTMVGHGALEVRIGADKAH